jgi:hypothetical protein
MSSSFCSVFGVLYKLPARFEFSFSFKQIGSWFWFTRGDPSGGCFFSLEKLFCGVFRRIKKPERAFTLPGRCGELHADTRSRWSRSRDIEKVAPRPSCPFLRHLFQHRCLFYRFYRSRWRRSKAPEGALHGRNRLVPGAEWGTRASPRVFVPNPREAVVSVPGAIRVGDSRRRCAQ